MTGPLGPPRRSVATPMQPPAVRASQPIVARAVPARTLSGPAARRTTGPVPARVTRNYISPLTGNRGITLKYDFMLAELDNAVRYFAAYFGPYPYESFGAAFHPYGFGQGFP